MILGLERSPCIRNSNPHHYCCIENPMHRGAWWATVHRVSKSWTWLSSYKKKGVRICFISQVYLLIFWLFLSLSPRNLCISAHAQFFFFIKIIAHVFLDLIFIGVSCLTMLCSLCTTMRHQLTHGEKKEETIVLARMWRNRNPAQ